MRFVTKFAWIKHLCTIELKCLFPVILTGKTDRNEDSKLDLNECILILSVDFLVTSRSSTKCRYLVLRYWIRW